MGRSKLYPKSRGRFKTWTWNKEFDLIHVRLMIRSFSDREWKNLYKQAHEYTSLLLITKTMTDHMSGT